MTDERAEYLASGTGGPTPDPDKLDLIRQVLSDDVTWSQPPPEVADRLFSVISAGPSSRTAPRRRRPIWQWAVAAAAVALIAAASLSGFFEPADRHVVAMEGTSVEPAATGLASIRESGPGWWIRLEVDGLPAADEGTYYEAWVWSDDGEGVSVGTFHLRSGTEPITLWSGVDPESYPSLWVTLEAEDGDPAASDMIVMTGRADGP